MLYSVLIIIDVLVAIAIVAFILLQQGKGASAGAAFGGGASSTVFGARGSASFLSRTTGILATVFFLNSLGLAYLAKHTTTPKSVVERLGVETPLQGGEPAKDQPEAQKATPAAEGKSEDVPQ